MSMPSYVEPTEQASHDAVPGVRRNPVRHIFARCPLDPSAPIGTCRRGFEVPTRTDCFKCGYDLGYQSAIEDATTDPDEGERNEGYE